MTGDDRDTTAESDAPADLVCRNCGDGYEAGPDEPWRCDCGHPLDFDRRPIPGGSRPPFSKLDTRRGLWTFFEFLPVSQQVTLGEGFTPLVRAEGWDAQFKLEYVFPTGSFKDRGATTTISRALELGVDTIVEDSSGNAGAAIATYAARAGLDADIYVPAGLPQSKLMAIQRSGARPVRVEGSRADVSEACVAAVEDGSGWYASHAWNPAFLAGTMTFALELAAQRDWSVPDAIVVPTGNGTLLLGAHRGFQVLREAGIVEDVPRLLAAQATGYSPVVEAVGSTPSTSQSGEEDLEPEVQPPNDLGDTPAAEVASASAGGGLDASFGDGSRDDAANDVANGIHIESPPRRDQLIAAIEDTGGDAVAVGEDRLELTLDRLHRAGFYVEPTCAVGPAALQLFRDAGVLDPGADVVVPLTGSGRNTM